MDVSRRSFLGGAAAVAAAGCATKQPLARYVAPGEIKALLLHLGHNMWCDWFPEDIDLEIVKAEVGEGRNPFPDTELRSKEELWRQATDYAAKKGVNMIVIDVGEALIYPSHPELAIKGSWSPEKMRDEIRRLNALGLEVIPKLNFSTTHNGWLKHYRRMLSTPTYYRLCEDLIADVAEIFDRPRFLHIGCDEETASHQGNSKRCMLVTVRKGEFWMHDLLHLVKTVEKNGMRAWMWSDYGWHHPEFYTRCPKSVLMSNWYYDESYGGFELATNKTTSKAIVQGFYDLDKAGFEQVPCGTNWVGWKRKQLGVGADDVIGKLVQVCRRDISKKNLKGFMMAPWASCNNEENLKFNLRGIDLFADALAGKIAPSKTPVAK